MDPQSLIARRVALELRSGDLVNLGIGIPTLVANYVPPDLKVFFQSENGLIGTGPIPEQGMAHPLLTDAGGRPISALPGASTFDSAMSFGLIRGGHVNVTVLGGLQVDADGHLANWMIPGKMVPGMGGAMDLVTGAKRVIVAMQHAAKGKSKIVQKCNLPLTSRGRRSVVTDMAVIGFPDGRITLLETAPGVSVAEVMAVTADLSIRTCSEMKSRHHGAFMQSSKFSEMKSSSARSSARATGSRLPRIASIASPRRPATSNGFMLIRTGERRAARRPTIAHGLLS